MTSREIKLYDTVAQAVDQLRGVAAALVGYALCDFESNGVINGFSHSMTIHADVLGNVAERLQAALDES